MGSIEYIVELVVAVVVVVLLFKDTVEIVVLKVFQDQVVHSEHRLHQGHQVVVSVAASL